MTLKEMLEMLQKFPSMKKDPHSFDDYKIVHWREWNDDDDDKWYELIDVNVNSDAKILIFFYGELEEIIANKIKEIIK